MKIAWFTPYHAHSAIGHYSQQAVAELRKEDEVVVFAPAAGVVAPPRTDGGPVETVGDGSYDDLLRRLEAYDVVVYNMGNHYHNHKMVYEVSIRRPGIVVLHDLVMRDFFRGYHLLQRRDPDGLARHVLYSDGQTATPLAWVMRQRRRRESMDDAAGLQFPMFKSALRRCLGVIVHSEYSRERVVAATSAPVAMLDFPPFGPCVSHSHETIPRSPHPSGKTQLLTFGVLNSNKLIHKVIEQIGQSPYLRANVTYTVVGEGDDNYVQRLRDAVDAHDLSHVVCLAGRLSDHELWRQLTRADLVVNLRNPHMGESSATLLNALFAGAATLVWNHGCYAEFPDDIVHKISSEDDLTLALERLCRDRPLRERMGSNARRHALARFDTAVFCQRFRDFADEVRSARPVLALTDLLSDRLLEFGTRPPNGLVERLAGEVAALAGTIPKKSASLAA
jgi:glycosyltransferase involved in cell wall biosynthesis